MKLCEEHDMVFRFVACLSNLRYTLLITRERTCSISQISLNKINAVRIGNDFSDRFRGGSKTLWQCHFMWSISISNCGYDRTRRREIPLSILDIVLFCKLRQSLILCRCCVLIKLITHYNHCVLIWITFCND